MSGWSLGIAAFLVTSDPDWALFWAKMYYFFPLVIACSLLYFVRTFHAKKPMSISWQAFPLIGFIAVAIPLLAKENFLFEELVYHDWGKQVVLNTEAYLLYSAYVLIGFGVSILYLLYNARKLQSVYRNQALLFGFGFLAASILGVVFNLILPWFNNYSLIWLGPVFTTIVAATVAYSIVRHKMFDIRSVIARSIAYTLSISLLLLVYILISIILRSFPLY